MAKLVPIKCPNCGAAMSVGAKDEVVTCSFCKASAFVRRPGRPPAPPPPMAAFGQAPRIYVDVPKAQASGAALGISIAVIALVGVVGGVIATTVRTGVASLGGDRGSSGVSGGDRGSSGVSGGERAGAEGKAAANPVKAKDMKQVDPADLLRQAVEVAKKVEPKSKLISAHFTELKNGQLDLTGASKAFVAFQYRWNDSSKPAGQDVVEGSFFINAEAGVFNTWAHHQGRNTSSDLREAKLAASFPLPFPGCTSAQAWAVAVTNGVPSDAISTVHWGKIRAHAVAQKAQWSFRVEGHDEYRREISDADCRLLRRWDKR